LIYNGIVVSQTLPERKETRRALGVEDDTLVGVVDANLILGLCRLCRVRSYSLCL
jgi:hypothetical protein